MKTREAVNRIRSATHDITEEYTDVECVWYLNTAIHTISAQLIAAHSPFLVKEDVFRDGDILPNVYYRTAGGYPVKITGHKLKFLTDAEELTIRYFYQPEEITLMDETEDLPFENEALNELAVRTAVILASNENEFDVSQDTNIQQMIQQAIASGLVGL